VEAFGLGLVSPLRLGSVLVFYLIVAGSILAAWTRPSCSLGRRTVKGRFLFVWHQPCFETTIGSSTCEQLHASELTVSFKLRTKSSQSPRRLVREILAAQPESQVLGAQWHVQAGDDPPKLSHPIRHCRAVSDSSLRANLQSASGTAVVSLHKILSELDLQKSIIFKISSLDLA
jgi:hypothetical protein